MDNNLQIFNQNGKVTTNDEELNRIIRYAEEDDDLSLGAVIPAITFEEEDPDKKVYLVLLSIYDTSQDSKDDILRQWEIKIGRQATYDYLKELVKYEAIDPNTSFIIGGNIINSDVIVDNINKEKNNINFNDVSPITVFRFLKVMRENNKILDGDDIFNINDFNVNDNSGDKTIFEV